MHGQQRAVRGRLPLGQFTPPRDPLAITAPVFTERRSREDVVGHVTFEALRSAARAKFVAWEDEGCDLDGHAAPADGIADELVEIAEIADAFADDEDALIEQIDSASVSGRSSEVADDVAAVLTEESRRAARCVEARRNFRHTYGPRVVRNPARCRTDTTTGPVVRVNFIRQRNGVEILTTDYGRWSGIQRLAEGARREVADICRLAVAPKDGKRRRRRGGRNRHRGNGLRLAAVAT